MATPRADVVLPRRAGQNRAWGLLIAAKQSVDLVQASGARERGGDRGGIAAAWRLRQFRLALASISSECSTYPSTKAKRISGFLS